MEKYVIKGDTDMCEVIYTRLKGFSNKVDEVGDGEISPERKFGDPDKIEWGLYHGPRGWQLGISLQDVSEVIQTR